MDNEEALELLSRSSAVQIGPDDKFILHITDSNVPREVLKGMSDVCTRVFGPDRSVVLVGDTIHINVVRGKNEQD